MLSLGDAIPALMAGAAVVLKPSEFTPLSLMKVVRAWKEEIGGPDVLDVVNGMGETGTALVDEVDFIQFTGSDRTGKLVMKRAADTLTPVSLELGGKDPMIVLADADIERATNAAAWGGMANSGQICMSIERVYVEEPIYDEFVAKLTEKVSDLRQGSDGADYEADVGAMATPAQVDIVEDHVEDARELGRADPHRRQAPRPPRPVVRADRDRRRRPLDEGDDRRDLRPDDPGDEGPRRRRGRAPRQRQPLRALGLGLLRRRRARRGGSRAASSAAP